MQNMVALAFTFLLSSPAMATQTDQQAVDALFAAYEMAGSPGCSLGVIRDAAFVYSKGYGLASLELGVPLAPNSVFYMASVSKQFTAASIVLAAEQGFLALDDDTHKYVAELPDNGEPNGWNPPAKLEPLVPDEFTIGQLGTAVFHRDSANHVSGLSVYNGRIRDVAFARTDPESKEGE